MPLVTLGSAEESSAGGVLEDVTDTIAALGGTFEVLLGANLLRDSHALLCCYWSLTRLPQLVNHSWVFSEILLASNQNDG